MHGRNPSAHDPLPVKGQNHDPWLEHIDVYHSACSHQSDRNPRRPDRALFLITTVLTSVTGFLFPFNGVTPGIILGILSMIVLVIAIIALYVGKLAGTWRGTYVISSTLALYFNFFVLIAQSFAKIPALKAIAPTQASPAFGITQVVVLVIFIVLTIRAFKKFRPA
jgi:hypothetical protein